MGLHAAVGARKRGHEVVVFESHEVAHHVRQWGHVRLFTPWSMLTTEDGLDFAGLSLDVPEATPTGAEFVSDYLEPIAAGLDVRPHTAVVQVGRTSLRKAETPGNPSRVHDRFRLLVETPDGLDVETADAVFDCTGVFGDPAPAGVGGMVAPGEVLARSSGHLRYGPVDVEDLAGKDVLVVGDGSSAATVIDHLLDLHPPARPHWVCPRPEAPRFASDPSDPLTGRWQLYERLVAARESIRFHGGVGVERMVQSGYRLQVTLTDGDRVLVDQLVACTGFRPDHRLTRELQRTVSWVNEGPAALADFLQGIGADPVRMVDTVLPPETITHPEPNFFVLGHKSFGRRSDFLLVTGYRQVLAALDRLGEPSTDADRP